MTAATADPYTMLLLLMATGLLSIAAALMMVPHSVLRQLRPGDGRTAVHGTAWLAWWAAGLGTSLPGCAWATDTALDPIRLNGAAAAATILTAATIAWAYRTASEDRLDSEDISNLLAQIEKIEREGKKAGKATRYREAQSDSGLMMLAAFALGTLGGVAAVAESTAAAGAAGAGWSWTGGAIAAGIAGAAATQWMLASGSTRKTAADEAGADDDAA